MKKSVRQKVYNKYGGKCAYCGCQLEKGWHIDHIEPYFHNWDEQTFKVNPRVKRGDDGIENYNPACPRCNKWKSTFSIEQFRKEIAEQIRRLNNYSSNYRLALSYGLVQETGSPVVFYFESINPQSK